jgi:tetratricopeptide (TPR) repeat protein
MKDDIINLKCPSCGSPMEAPNQQGISECLSCHTKIIVPQSETSKENKNLSRYQELCEVAKEAKNGSDLLKYANEILEIDPKNIDGWMDKAIATSWKATPTNDCFDEAYDYLKRAREIDPSNKSITETENSIQESQFAWYIRLAHKANIKAAEMLRTRDIYAGRKYGQDWTIKAMEYYVKALRIKPDDPSTLQSTRLTGESGSMIGITWGSEVQAILIGINQSRAQQVAAEQKVGAQQATADQLKGLYEILKQCQAELTKLKQKKGFFANWDIEDIQKEIRKVSAEIERLEKIARGNA